MAKDLELDFSFDAHAFAVQLKALGMPVERQVQHSLLCLCDMHSRAIWTLCADGFLSDSEAKRARVRLGREVFSCVGRKAVKVKEARS